MSEIFLPLRSNAAWFTNADTRVALERRMKQYALLYDQVVLQNGRYRCIATEAGGLEMYVPPSEDVEERRSISFYTPGDQFALRVAEDPDGTWHPLLDGEVKASYEVDFFPIIHDAGLLGVDYFPWLNGDLEPAAKSKAKAAAGVDRRDSELRSVLPDVRFLRNSIIDGLYIDAALGQALELPFGVDAHTAAAIDWKRRQIQKMIAPDVTATIFQHWIAVGCPDYSHLSWEELHDLRESPAGHDFRRMLERLTDRVQVALPNVEDTRALSEIVAREFNLELVRELLARKATYTKATLNLTANLIPYGSVPSTVKDLHDAIKEERSWVCLLGGAEGEEYRAFARSWF
jgi:hypothetical protein